MKELKIFHPNAKGTGSCLKVTQIVGGDVMLTIYPQKQSCGLPDFNWGDGVSFIADWCILSEVLMVFRGERESLNDGMGIVHGMSDGAKYRLRLRHIIEPMSAYMLDVDRAFSGEIEERHFLIHNAEALGLSRIIEGVLHHTLIGGEP